MKNSIKFLKYTTSSIFLFILLTGINGCDNNENKIKNDVVCEKEYALYGNTVSKFKIRMEDTIQNNGCKVIPIYASIIHTEAFDLLDSMEENEDLMKQFIKLFYFDNEIFESILHNNNMRKLIFTNSLHAGFIENFTYLMTRKVHNNELNQMKKQPINLNYVLIASLYGSKPKDSFTLYKKLQSSITKEELPIFILLLSSVKEQYSFQDILENFTVLKNNISKNNFQKLITYPQYIGYLFYPTKEMMNLGMLDSFRFRKYQKNIQKMTIYLFNEMSSKYHYDNKIESVPFALKSIENIYPYLLEQYDTNIDNFKQLFHVIIDKDFMYYLYTDDLCSDKSKNNFAVFGKNNIKNIIKFRKAEKQFVNTLANNLKNDIGGFMSFVYVANFYNTMEPKEWSIFKDLLLTLPHSNFQKNIHFLQLLEQNGYFRNIVQQSDYDVFIHGSDGKNHKKYKYILLTHYPTDEDPSIYDRILVNPKISNQFLSRSLITLMANDKSTLETHNFTTYEKAEAMVDAADYALMGVSLFLAPFTGGASLAIVATRASRFMAKNFIKKGIKRNIKLMQISTKSNLRKAQKFIKAPIQYTKIKKRQENMMMIQNKVTNIGHIPTGITILGTGVSFLMGDEKLKINNICEER